MKRSRLAALAFVGVLAALLLWALWPEGPVPEPAAPKAARVARHHASRPSRPRWSPPAHPDEDEADEAPMAIPASPSGDPADTGASASHVTIHVQYPDGAPVQSALMLESRDCWAWGGGRGPDLVFQTERTRCTVRVGRPDGRLFAWSDPVDVDLPDGKDATATAVIPREETGGLGVAFSRDLDGMVVERVMPGSPAEQMGLVEGDVIVEVDGLPTDALTEDEFVAVMTGPVGTSVDFVVGEDVDTGFEERPLRLVRTRID